MADLIELCTIHSITRIFSRSYNREWILQRRSVYISPRTPENSGDFRAHARGPGRARLPRVLRGLDRGADRAGRLPAPRVPPRARAPADEPHAKKTLTLS